MEIKSVTKKKQNDKILALWHRSKMAVTWLFATFLISICSVCRGQYADVNTRSIPLFFHFSVVAKNRT